MDIKSSVLQLMKIKGNARAMPYDENRDRFKIPHSADTNLRDDLNANRILVNGSNIAIATQYPFPHQLEAQLQLLVDNRTPALVILASDNDIMNNELPDYFSNSATYGQIKTSSTFINSIELGKDIKAKMYKLEIMGYQATIDVPVIHVHNWPDHQTVSAETTQNLVTLIASTVRNKRNLYEKMKSRALDDNKKLLPLIHCKAGVGRSGQTIAAMAMKRYPTLNLAAITENLRQSRNDLMIQTPTQMETLLKMELMAIKRGKFT